MNTKQAQKAVGWTLVTAGMYLYTTELWVIPTVFGVGLASNTAIDVEYRSEKNE